MVNFIEGGLVIILILGIGYAGQWLETNKERLSSKTKLNLKEADIRDKELDLKLEIVRFRAKELDRYVLPMINESIEPNFKVIEDMRTKEINS